MSEVQQENSQELIADFVDEAIDSLRSLPDHLAAFRQNTNDADAINAVFRPVHSIKGCAGFLGLTTIKVFSHALENTLDEVRKNNLVLSEDLQRLLIGGLDLLEAQLQRADAGDIEDELGDEERRQLDKIAQAALQCRVNETPEDELLGEILKLADEIAQAGFPCASDFANRARQAVEHYNNGQQPSCGEDEEEASAAPQRPTAAEFTHVMLRCGDEDVSSRVAALLEIFLAAQQDQYSQQHGADFLSHSEQFAQWAESANQSELAQAVRKGRIDFKTIYDSPLDVDASLLEIVWDHLWPELCKLDGAPNLAGEPASSDDDDQPAGSATASTDPEVSADDKPKPGKSRMVRVKEEQVDAFLNDVSNLFITGELLKDLQSRMTQDGHMRELVEELRQINGAFNIQSNDLQQSVVALQRVEIKSLFAKIPRMVRTLADQLDKKIDVQVLGENVEVDKLLIESLDAPLTHMIRNACDHGIETPEERLERGVSETGTVTLKAELTRTHVVITIQDDGRGIDDTRLRSKAVEKGIYTQEEANALSKEESLMLVFHAGLSTAEKLSDVSGRGVGMDVVRSNLADHNGEVRVESQVGVGSTFRLEIPIREAVLVIDGLMLQQSGENFVLPFEHILEISELSPDNLKPVQGSQVAIIRNQTFAAVSLGDVLGLPQEHRDEAEQLAMTAVLVGCKAGEVCLLVDRVCGHRQVVVNSINDVLPNTNKIAGVAQLGGGHLALVLGVEDLVRSLSEASVS